MRVNSVNNIKFNYTSPSFRHVAVPYPEYENAYHNDKYSPFDNFTQKLSDLFKPKVTSETENIKNTIDTIYKNDAKLSPKAHLLSVIG